MLSCRNILVLFTGFFIFFISCRQPRHHAVSRGFYYWKTIYRPSAFELNKLRQLQVQKMYVRLFDVDQDPATGRAIPIAPIRMRGADTGFAYVPVVFITQKALAVLTDSVALLQLARNICHLAEITGDQAGMRPSELQIDCDWTSGSKEKYFALLRMIKRQQYMQGKTLSCTIRLHQVKYITTSGIPPADRGLVMCYSMGNLKKPGPHNSILDAEEAKDYLKHVSTYPLPLDIALPLFEWCVLFRGQHFGGILHDIATETVKGSGLFRHKEGNLYTCLQDSVWQGFSFKQNDEVRLEQPEYKDVLDIAGYSAQQIANPDMNVIFFDCDSITLKKFSTDELEAIYNRYR